MEEFQFPFQFFMGCSCSKSNLRSYVMFIQNTILFIHDDFASSVHECYIPALVLPGGEQCDGLCCAAHFQCCGRAEDTKLDGGQSKGVLLGENMTWTDKKSDEACSQGRLRATEPHEALPSALHGPGHAGDEELVREESVFCRDTKHFRDHFILLGCQPPARVRTECCFRTQRQN